MSDILPDIQVSPEMARHLHSKGLSVPIAAGQVWLNLFDRPSKILSVGLNTAMVLALNSGKISMVQIPLSPENVYAPTIEEAWAFLNTK